MTSPQQASLMTDQLINYSGNNWIMWMKAKVNLINLKESFTRFVMFFDTIIGFHFHFYFNCICV